LESNAKLIITDSGGLQEESCILGVPCVTRRENTERPETLDVGSNILAGTDSQIIVDKSRIMLDKKTDWKNPYGDGHAARRMVDVLVEAGLETNDTKASKIFFIRFKSIFLVGNIACLSRMKTSK